MELEDEEREEKQEEGEHQEEGGGGGGGDRRVWVIIWAASPFSFNPSLSALAFFESSVCGPSTRLCATIGHRGFPATTCSSGMRGPEVCTPGASLLPIFFLSSPLGGGAGMEALVA